MTETKTFYYRFNPINLWLILNAALLITLSYCCARCPCIFYWPQTQVLWGVLIFSLAAWAWKYLIRHPLATTDNDGITLDHCRLLRWQDIQSTEKKNIPCWFKKNKILVLHPREGIKYEYNFLQKHNCGFTPFSIPLYGIVRENDLHELLQIIDEKIKKENK